VAKTDLGLAFAYPSNILQQQLECGHNNNNGGGYGDRLQAPHCKKYKRTKPHPPKVSVKKCMWNKKHTGFHFKNICKKMGLAYIAKDKFAKGKPD
jgi:hypothetical protein